MTNQEIMQNIDNLINQNLNYCDFIMELKKMNKEYKKSLFYKTTHITLIKLVQQYKEYQLFNLDSLFNLIQMKLNTLDTTNLMNALNKLEDAMAFDVTENKAILDSFVDLKNVINFTDQRGE